MLKIIIALILLVSTAYAVEYSADVIAGAAMLSVGIDCPPEVQEKSKFTVNATITNPGEENATDVIAELIAPRKAFSYGQPKKRIGNIDGNTQTIVSWNVKAKRPGYNITVIASGKAETTEEELFAQDEKTIVVSSSDSVGIIQGFYDYVYRLFKGGWL